MFIFYTQCLVLHMCRALISKVATTSTRPPPTPYNNYNYHLVKLDFFSRESLSDLIKNKNMYIFCMNNTSVYFIIKE